jgi:hypothetical protein
MKTKNKKPKKKGIFPSINAIFTNLPAYITRSKSAKYVEKSKRYQR